LTFCCSGSEFGYGQGIPGKLKYGNWVS